MQHHRAHAKTLGAENVNEKWQIDLEFIRFNLLCRANYCALYLQSKIRQTAVDNLVIPVL